MASGGYVCVSSPLPEHSENMKAPSSPLLDAVSLILFAASGHLCPLVYILYIHAGRFLLAGTQGANAGGGGNTVLVSIKYQFPI